jgi:hypothetical protein
VSDHKTSTLSSRLTRLADELTPSADPGVQVRAARTHYRRQRRNRIVLSGIAAAVAAAVVGVPTVVGSLSATPERGEVARPGEISTSETPPEKTPGPPPTGEDARKASRWDGQLAQQAERDERLRPFAERLAAAFSARPAPLSLTGPAVDVPCPDRTPDLTNALAVPVTESEGTLFGGCRWSNGGSVVVEVAFVPGTSAEEFSDATGAEIGADGCYVTSLPGVTSLTGILLCEEDDGGMSWRIRSVDSSLVGHWRLSTTLGEGAVEDDVAAVVALVDLADGAW